jgi:hypothetical protein
MTYSLTGQRKPHPSCLTVPRHTPHLRSCCPPPLQASQLQDTFLAKIADLRAVHAQQLQAAEAAAEAKLKVGATADWAC